MIPTHLDDLTGLVTDAAFHFLGPRARDTRDQLHVYEGLSIDELFPAPRTVPDAKVSARWSVPGLRSEDVVFRSTHEPLAPGYRRSFESAYDETRTVYARRLRARGHEDRPRILYIHGFMQPETVLEEVGLVGTAAARMGVEIVQIQPAFHGRRSPSGTLFGGELFWTADLVRSFEALRQTLHDARTLLSRMLAEDPRPVGVAGLSLGGALTLGLTCLDERFAFSIPLIAHMDLAAMVRDAPVLHTMRRQLAGFGWNPDDFRGFVERVGWYGLRPRIPAERIHLFAASSDRFFDPAVVESMSRDWGLPDVRWYDSSHMGFLVHLPFVVGEMGRIVERHAADRTAPASTTASVGAHVAGSR
ncbi:MAG: alpha/beta hydrolase family protein [Alphaproteobacteria bacterium]